ncbi:MAG: ATP-binding protein [Christensenellales bacterium]
MSDVHLSLVYDIRRGDYTRAGEASAEIKRALRQLGVQADILRRVSVASYEAELNLVIHSLGGQLRLEVGEDSIKLQTEDSGPGIADIQAAMRAGFSTADEEARGLGFGAGMGLPNMKRNADSFAITSQPGQGTSITMGFRLHP